MIRAQFRALLAAQYRSLRNTWSKTRTAGLILQALLALGAVGAALLLAVGMGFLGAAIVGQGALARLAAFDALALMGFFFSFAALSVGIQRDDLVNLRKMLYLPVSPFMLYALNFAVALASLPVLYWLAGGVGLSVGLAIGGGAHLLPACLLALLFFVLLYAAADYFIRGWFAALMENKRRRMLVLSIFPMVIVLAAQIPNLLMNVVDLSQIPMPKGITPLEAVEAANILVPVLWLPYAFHLALECAWGGYLLCLAMLGCAFCFFLLWGYKTTMAYYLGQAGAARKQRRQRRVRTLTRARVPFLAPASSSLLVTLLLTCLRHPFIRMALLSPVFLVVLIPIFAGGFGEGAGRATRVLVPVGLLMWPMLSVSGAFMNSFGIEKEGFRRLILLPAPRWRYVLAYNAAVSVVYGAVTALYIGVGAWVFGLGPRQVLIMVLFAAFAAPALAAGSMLQSIFFPFPIQRDAFRPHGKVKGVQQLAALLTLPAAVLLHIPLLLALALDFAAPLMGYRGPSAGILLMLICLALSFTAYALALKPLGRLLARRELQIVERLDRDRD